MDNVIDLQAAFPYLKVEYYQNAGWMFRYPSKICVSTHLYAPPIQDEAEAVAVVCGIMQSLTRDNLGLYHDEERTP